MGITCRSKALLITSWWIPTHEPGLYILQALSGTINKPTRRNSPDKIEKRFMEQAQKAGF